MNRRVVNMVCWFLLLLAAPVWAGSTAITGELIWPSQNDLAGTSVGGSAGDGKTMLEKQWRKAVGTIAKRNNVVIAGGALPASDPDLTISIPTGSAILDGHYVEWPATSITLPASNTSHIFVKLVFSGSLITGAEIEDNTSAVNPASSTKLGTATTSGSAVTSTVDQRIFRHTITALTSGTSWIVPAGIVFVRVRIVGASGGGGEGGGGSDGSNPGVTGNTGNAGGTTSWSTTITVTGGAGGGGGGGGAAGGGSGGSGNTGSAGSATATGGIAESWGHALGGGGGGGGAGSGGGAGGPGGQGGPGAAAEVLADVSGSSSISYAVGAGGAGGDGAGNGAAGSTGLPGIIYLEYP